MKFLFYGKISLIFFALLIAFNTQIFAIIETHNAQISSANLSGVNNGNTSNFEIFFSLSSIPSDANIISAKLIYTQTNNSSGLLRVINKYTGEVLESRLMNDTGIFEINTVLNNVKSWIQSPNTNYGLIFQSNSMMENDLISFSNFKIELEYLPKDNTPPLFLNQELRSITSNSAQIYIMSDEATFINVYYGKTSLYGNEILSDNVEASIEHTVNLVGLAEGQTYHYKVEIFDNSGNSIKTSNNTFDTLTEYTNTSNLIIDSKIFAPTNFKVTQSKLDSKYKINLSWDAVSDQRIKGYIIYRATSKDTTYKEYKVLSSGQTSFEDFIDDIELTYTYYVRAYTITQLGAKSEEKSIKPSLIIDEDNSGESTLRIFLILLAAVFIIIFLYYSVLKKLGFAERAKKDIRNILKEPEFFKEN